MASGTISLGSSGKIKGRITWSSASNGTDANSSNVTATIQVARNDSGYTTTGTWTGALNIGGTTKDFSVHSGVSSDWVTLLSFSVTIKHNADGTGSCYISGQINAPSGTSQAGNSVYDNDTVTLDRIPRQANITAAPNFNDESNPTITYSNPAGSAVDSLQACISLTGAADDIAYRNISKTGTSYTFNLTTAERNVLRNSIPNDTSRTVRFYVKTVINGVSYLSFISKTFTIVNGNPTITPVIMDTNSKTIELTGSSNKLVRYFSNVAITTGAAAIKGATLKSQKVTNGSKSITSSAGNISGVESGRFTFSATDSRGNSSSLTIDKEIVNYVKLTCNMGGNTPSADGRFTFNVTGNFYNGSFGAAANTLAVYYRYKVSGGSYSSWVLMTVTKSGNTYTATAELTGLDYQTSYVFQAYAVDKLETKTTAERTIKSEPVFDWSSEDFNINVPLNVKGKTVLRVNGENNNTVLSATDAEDGIFLRPNGTGSAEGQAYLTKDGELFVNGMQFAANKILWSGSYYMTGGQSAPLSEAISAQPHGVVLIFSRYSSGAAENANFNYFFIPKQQVALHGGAGSAFTMCTVNFSVICCKYLYISDKNISGNDLNSATGSNNGITYANNGYVLRYVIGV